MVLRCNGKDRVISLGNGKGGIMVLRNNMGGVMVLGHLVPWNIVASGRYCFTKEKHLLYLRQMGVSSWVVDLGHRDLLDLRVVLPEI